MVHLQRPMSDRNPARKTSSMKHPMKAYNRISPDLKSDHTILLRADSDALELQRACVDRAPAPAAQHASNAYNKVCQPCCSGTLSSLFHSTAFLYVCPTLGSIQTLMCNGFRLEYRVPAWVAQQVARFRQAVGGSLCPISPVRSTAFLTLLSVPPYCADSDALRV
jgi:hypothetical protein